MTSNKPSTLGALKKATPDPVTTLVSNFEGSMGFDESPISPLSPSSAFSVSSISNVEHSFVDALLLCQWDNILGPRLEHVWYISGRPQPHTNTLRYITSLVLSGEICRDVNLSQVIIMVLISLTYDC